MALLNRDREIALAKRVNSGDQAAREELITANIGLVWYVAKRYCRCENAGIGFDDMIQEGIFGLMTAVKRFDYKKGNKFSTYATWWIRQAIQRSLYDKSRNIRLPVHVYEKVCMVKKAVRALSLELNRDPDLDEVSARTGIIKEDIIDMLNASVRVKSLEENIDSHNGFDDFLMDVASDVDLFEDIANDEVNKKVSAKVIDAVDRLTYREKEVIKMRFGIHGEKEYTLEEIGKRFEVTRERIRQIERKALNKLRRNKELKALKELE